MANIKITDLTAYTDPLNTDVLPIVDVTSDTTKKVSIADLLENAGSGSASAPGIAFDGDSNTGIYRPGADQLALATNGTGRLFIDASGNVGIGASQNTSKFNVLTGTSNSTIMELTGASAGRGLKVSTYANVANDAGVLIEAPWATYGQLAFGTAGTERVRIDSSGNVKIASEHLRFNTSGKGIIFGTEGGSNRPSIIGNYTSSSDNEIVFNVTGFERMKIDSSGRLGVGTSSPATDLHIASSGAPTVTLSGGSTSFKPVITFGDSSERSSIQGGYAAGGGGYLLFRTDTTGGTSLNRLYIGNDGNVGIGTTSPNHILTLNTDSGACFAETAAAGYTAGTNSVYYGQDTAGEGYFWNRGNNDLLLGTNNTERARIDSSGRLLVGTSSSDGNYYGTTGHASLIQASASGSGTAGYLAQSWVVNPGTTAAHGAHLAFARSRGTTDGSYTSVAANDKLSVLSSQGADGSKFVEAARIEVEVDGTPGTNDMPGRLVFSTTADGASTPTERMRVDSSGHLLVGKTVADNATVGITFFPSGIGSFVADGTRSGTFIRKSSDGSVVEFRRDAATVGSISVTTSTTAYNTSSDYRLKENVVPLTGAADRVNQLQVRRFNFIADPDTTVDGFIAHEAQDVVPECVTGTKDEVDDEGNPVYQGIDQSKLVPLLTAALQEALAKIETLEARLTAAGI
jgi:hypothetical protein